MSYPVNMPLHGYSTGLFDGLNNRDRSYPRFGNAPYIDSQKFLALQQECKELGLFRASNWQISCNSIYLMV